LNDDACVRAHVHACSPMSESIGSFDTHSQCAILRCNAVSPTSRLIFHSLHATDVRLTVHHVNLFDYAMRNPTGSIHMREQYKAEWKVKTVVRRIHSSRHHLSRCDADHVKASLLHYRQQACPAMPGVHRSLTLNPLCRRGAS
jgi:hypothetical protein